MTLVLIDIQWGKNVALYDNLVWDDTRSILEITILNTGHRNKDEAISPRLSILQFFPYT